MIAGDGLVQVKEINDMLGLPHGTAYEYMLRGVYHAVQLRTRSWVVREQDVAIVADRIMRYRSKLPFDPIRNMTINEAAELLQISMAGVYALAHRRELDWGEGELYKYPTKESVNRLLRRRGLREIA